MSENALFAVMAVGIVAFGIAGVVADALEPKKSDYQVCVEKAITPPEREACVKLAKGEK